METLWRNQRRPRLFFRQSRPTEAVQKLKCAGRSVEDLALPRRRSLGQMHRLIATLMDLADILTKEQIVTDLQARDRWQAIDELLGVLVAAGKIRSQDREAIAQVVRRREQSMSTGIGFGIGIPHASTDLIQEVVGALGRSRHGVDFEALDNQPVKLVMLFLVPQGQFQKHLHTLANIAKLLHKAEFRKALEEAPDAETMMALIRQHCGKR